MKASLLVPGPWAGLLLLFLAVAGVARAQHPGPAPAPEMSVNGVECWVSSAAGLQPCVRLPAASGCELEGHHASPDSRTRATITVVNRRDVPVSVYWLDQDGQRTFYRDVAPASRYFQSTFAGHHWVVALPTGQCIAVFRAADAQRG